MLQHIHLRLMDGCDVAIFRDFRDSLTNRSLGQRLPLEISPVFGGV